MLYSWRTLGGKSFSQTRFVDFLLFLTSYCMEITFAFSLWLRQKKWKFSGSWVQSILMWNSAMDFLLNFLASNVLCNDTFVKFSELLYKICTETWETFCCLLYYNFRFLSLNNLKLSTFNPFSTVKFKIIHKICNCQIDDESSLDKP